MREIKFRAWDTLKNEYWNFSKKRNGVDEGYLVIEEGELLYAEIGGLNPVEKDRFILEQYTGLKDKNGKEIYEGDVVKCHDRFEKLEIKGVIHFYWDGWRVKTEEGFHRFAVILDGSMEVIGNIHEKN